MLIGAAWIVVAKPIENAATERKRARDILPSTTGGEAMILAANRAVRNPRVAWQRNGLYPPAEIASTMLTKGLDAMILLIGNVAPLP